ncbi:MAG: thiamine-monophosphate kinase [Nitrospirae bacterium]|nr:thiamine-monophosphate kinase [Nitrospirota bacterium]
MKLSNLGEFGLIHAIQQLSSRRSPDTTIGMGDDAAVLKHGPATLLLATTDMLIEGVHFDLSSTDFYSLGWKSAAINLSDIAAMGGVPRFCLTSLALPARIPVEAVMEFYQGFNALLRVHKTVLVGGDTCSSKGGLVISVTALGEAKKRTVISRAGAKRGDRIFVTGTLGDSGAGLELLKSLVRSQGSGVRGQRSGVRSRKSGVSGKDVNSALLTEPALERINRGISALIKRHLRPVPRVEWGRRIALSGCASSMIDVSDGLSSDLSHLCEESGVGAVLRSDAIPLSRSLLRSADHLNKPALHYALSGGEDYELLFTVPSAQMKKLQALHIPVTEIGMIMTEKRMYLVNAAGRKTALKPSGYNHFKKRVNTCAKRSTSPF